jgi:hypothetical protein
MENQLITVFADASHWGDAGGYAYWARGDNQRIQGSGAWPCPNISEAETVGLAVALMISLDRLTIEDYGSIVLQSDSLDALTCFRDMGFGKQAKSSDRRLHQFTPYNDIQKAFVRKAGGMAKERGLSIWLKHVKGHSGKDEARSWVNEWCDREAKDARRLCVSQMAARTERMTR